MTDVNRIELETILANLGASNVDMAVDAIERMIDDRVSAAMRRHLEQQHGYPPQKDPRP